jgi:hypothetical protein
MFKSKRTKRLNKQLERLDKIKASGLLEAIDIILLKSELKEKILRLSVK